MGTEELYQGLKRLQANDAIGNAYGGCDCDEEHPEDGDVLSSFYELIMDKYEDSRPPWAEAFIQIFSWQFQTLHECAECYYGNFYGASEYKTIMRVAEYLRENGYDEIAEPYAAAAADCKRYQYPEDKTALLPDQWIFDNEEPIWKFYVSILEKNRAELLR